VADPPPSLAVTLAPGRKGDPLELSNPVLAAAGTFGIGTELQRIVEPSRLGAVITPGIARSTRSPRDRHGAPCRVIVAETPAGLLVAPQYPTVGYRVALRDLAPLLATRDATVIANLPAYDADECEEVSAVLAEDSTVAAIELDTPAIWDGTGESSAVVAAVRGIVQRVRQVWHGPLIVKLAYADAAAARAAAAREGGADVISLGGGFPGVVVRRREAGAGWRRVAGRLVGPATRPLALGLIGSVVEAVDVPVIASGGITTGSDAVEFLLAGATAVQVGSATFASPRAAADVVDGIAAYLAQNGETDVRRIIGAAPELPRA
jgi:dihydroorotate dehydrogenase (NAD+) catalytic subunit